MVHLLDVNVLIALNDEAHDFHKGAIAWFSRDPQRAWATCPITENGFVRILGHRNYPAFPGGTGAAREMLNSLCLLPGHQFWPDSLSITDRTLFSVLPDSKHLTDCYLLALAVERSGRFVTLDHAVDVSKVRGGAKALFVIPK
ncbi:MAG: TA system VapC family ribonuclease toxin [Chthoniobacterales bacterium]